MPDTKVIDLVGNFFVDENSKGENLWHAIVCKHCKDGTQQPTISYTVEWALEHLSDKHPEVELIS